MCLSDTEKGFQTHMRRNTPSQVRAPQWRDWNKFPQARQIAINGDWNRRLMYEAAYRRKYQKIAS